MNVVEAGLRMLDRKLPRDIIDPGLLPTHSEKPEILRPLIEVVPQILQTPILIL